jgi:hypothetical protein
LTGAWQVSKEGSKDDDEERNEWCTSAERREICVLGCLRKLFDMLRYDENLSLADCGLCEIPGRKQLLAGNAILLQRQGA